MIYATTRQIPFHKTRRAFISFKEKHPAVTIDRVVDHLISYGHNPDTIKAVIRDYYGISYTELREHCKVLTAAG